MEKLYNNKGQVAVAISYGYGAGWSTWNDVDPMDKRYNEFFIKGDYASAMKLAKKENNYAGGLNGVEIIWLDKGTKFEIDEYDGSESLTLVSNLTNIA